MKSCPHFTQDPSPREAPDLPKVTHPAGPISGSPLYVIRSNFLIGHLVAECGRNFPALEEGGTNDGMLQNVTDGGTGI